VFSDEEVERIFKDVFPDSEPYHKEYNSNQKDALQLYAHKIADRDLFVTTDKTILNKRFVLAKNWGIQVQSLDEYVSKRKSRLFNLKTPA
jgi:hypothetical protein